MSEALTGTNGGDAPRDRIAELQEDWRLEVQLHSKTKAQLAAMKQERDRLKEAAKSLPCIVCMDLMKAALHGKTGGG